MRRLAGIILPLAVAGCVTTPHVDDATGPPAYDAPHVSEPITMDGRPYEAAWDAAVWSEPFRDIEGDRRPAPRHETRMKMVWDDDALYIAAVLEEPHVCGFLENRDAIIYRDNDFEVFIDPDGDTKDYYEIEVNARNTVMDLLMNKPYNKGGTFDLDWDLEGIETAVHIDGTLNDPSDMDRQWTIELRLPWSALAEHTTMRCPPAPGNTWRISFSRVQWRYDIVKGAYVKVAELKEDNWTWSDQGAVNMHIPGRWGYVRFAP